jgi:hypothetical protein
VSTQINDAVLNMAPNNQKTEVVPSAEVREDLPLRSDPKAIFLGSIRTCGAGGGLCREIVGGFTRVTCSAGQAGVSANSQLTLRVDHSMKPVSVAESTAIAAACHRL